MRFQTQTERLGVRLSAEERATAEQVAAARGLTLSEFVRAAVSVAVALDEPPHPISSPAPSPGVR